MSWRPRISLRSLLLLVMFLALAIALTLTTIRLRKSDDELRVLRRLAGYLTVEDPTKLLAVSLPSEEPQTWRWRVFFPKGHRYAWHAAYDKIPQLTPPPRGTTRDIASISNEQDTSAEHQELITAALRRQENGNWRLSAQATGDSSNNRLGGISVEIPAQNMQWFGQVSSTDGQVLGSRGPTTVDPKGPIILLQSRPCQQQPDGSYMPSAEPAPGFMIWLEAW